MGTTLCSVIAAFEKAERPSAMRLTLMTGTGVVAQAGAWILAAIVWGSVFSHDLILFSVHPLLNSAAVLFFVQGILILQPTHTAAQKKQGTYTRHLHSYRTASDRRDNTVLHA